MLPLPPVLVIAPDRRGLDLEVLQLARQRSGLAHRRRADYEQPAEALIHISLLETEQSDYGPDVKESPLDEGDDGAIIKGVQGHLRALWGAIDWYDPRTLRKFYAELRLWNDELERELEKGPAGGRLKRLGARRRRAAAR